MPFHFCTDELLAILAALPFIGIFFHRLHAWWHKRFNHKCHEKNCDSSHLEHDNSLIASRSEDWDLISRDDVEARFGKSLINDLVWDSSFFKELPMHKDFTWWIVNGACLAAAYQGRIFIHVIESNSEFSWYEEKKNEIV